jgi:hypothetical protein
MSKNSGSKQQKHTNSKVTGAKAFCMSTDSSPLPSNFNLDQPIAIGMAKHDTQAIQNSGIELEDLKSEVAPILTGMGTGISEKRTLFASPAGLETIESLRYPESKNHASEDSIGFNKDNVSEDDIGSMERNVRLGYIGLHYNDSELPEADDLLEVIGAIEEQDARILLDTGCSTYVISDDYVARNGIERIPVKKQPIDLAVTSAKRVQLTHRTSKIKLSVGTTTVEKSFYILPLPHYDAIIGMPFFKENTIDLSNINTGDIMINDCHIPTPYTHRGLPRSPGLSPRWSVT